MPTTVFSKQQFLDFVSTLQDDDVILCTGEIDGNLTVNQKKNKKRITFAYAADAFARSGDIGHWAFGKTPVWSFTVCKPEDISEGAKKILLTPLPSNTK